MSRITHRARFGAVTLSAVAVFALAACSTPSSTLTGDAANAVVPDDIAALAEAATGPQETWAGPTTSPEIASDVFVVGISSNLAAEGISRNNDGAAEAAAELGWTYQSIDAAGSSDAVSAAIRQAISLGADAIALNTVEPALSSEAIAEARAAGIVVVNTDSGREDEPVTDSSVQHDVPLNGQVQGEMLGAKMCADLGGAGSVLILPDPQFALLVQRLDATVEVLAECQGISTTEVQINAGDIGTALQSQVKQVVAANPDADAIWLGADAFAPDIQVALDEIGSDIAIYSFDGNAQIVAGIRDGDSNVVATVGAPMERQGWAQMDNINRLLQGEGAVEDAIDSRLLTADNVPDTDRYDGEIDFKAIYLELWTTGSYAG
jgi:ABC-type sugar transport system substrate-binding protein